MQTLVVGGAGFVGSHLVDRLLADGHHVDVIDDLSTGSLSNLADARSRAGGVLKLHHLDIRSASVAELIARRAPTVIFHLAVLPPGHSIVTSAEVAVGGTVNLLEAAAAAGVGKVVVTLPATAYYGGVGARDLPVKEGVLGAVTSAATVLARSVADLLAHYREARGLEFTALALAEVYGARQRPHDGLVAALFEARSTASAASLPGDGRQAGDFVYIDDTVDAIVRAALKGSGLVVNVGTGTQTPARDVHALVCPANPPWVPAPRREHEPVRFALSPVRARIQLAWAPWTSLADGIAELLANAAKAEPDAAE